LPNGKFLPVLLICTAEAAIFMLKFRLKFDIFYDAALICEKCRTCGL